MITLHRQFVQIFITLAFLFCLPYFAQAQTISPKLLDITVEKREIQTRDITLTNDSGFKRIYATVNEISLDENGEIKAFEYATNEDRTDTVTSWLEISRGRISLEPGETKTIPLTIRVNPKAKPGLYHAFIGFPVASNKSEAQSKAMAGKAPGVMVRLAIDQERKEFLRLDGFSVERFVTNQNEEVVKYTLNNPGETEIIPRGEIIFYDSSGNEESSLEINPDQVEIAPGEQSQFTAMLPEALKAGKHKAFMSLEYGNDQLASLNDTTFFYVMPLSTMLMIFGGVMIFALLVTIYLYRKMHGGSHYHFDGTEDVALYLRDGESEAQEHDIDLKQKKTE